MNYIKINNVDSRDIDGLFIAQLPPIAKPEMRVETTEIDGRDGTIIDLLGYSAYEKKAVIGVLPNADVDPIIDFFSGGGEVVFSNEPERFYRASILAQIDYEQIIRMRRAEVTFFCQPYKYAFLDKKRIFSAPTSPIGVVNYGNVMAAPIYKISGKNTVIFTVNGEDVLEIAFGGEFVTVYIDTEELDAKLENGTLVNRSVAGEYEDMRLQRGKNTIAWRGGQIQSIEIERFARWL